MTTRFKNTETYEEFTVGDRYEVGSYDLTKDEIMEFARRWDPMPYHIDEEAAAASQHGGIIASGAHLLALRIHLIQRNGTNPNVVASGGYDQVRFLRPARAGDTLTLFGECKEKRESRSKPDRGVVTIEMTLQNQDGEPVLSMLDTIVVYRAGAVPSG